LGRTLTPFALWAGIVAGPAAWAADLTLSYALVKPACESARHGVLQAITGGSLLVIAGGVFFSWRALQAAGIDGPTDGGSELQRARFMAVLGLATGALFTVQVLAGAVPRWVLDACL
jgi:hypothetical protein